MTSGDISAIEHDGPHESCTGCGELTQHIATRHEREFLVSVPCCSGCRRLLEGPPADEGIDRDWDAAQERARVRRFAIEAALEQQLAQKRTIARAVDAICDSIAAPRVIDKEA
jgi:hypothetical protein